MIALTVVREFGNYPKGSTITDPKTVADILAGHNQRDVVKFTAPDAPAVQVIAPIAQGIKPVEQPQGIQPIEAAVVASDFKKGK
jgi:hypothetical protein